jgi:hypothetical protein
MAWERYIRTTGSTCSNRLSGGYHWGHVKAWSGVTYARRYVPIGVRDPWMLRHYRRGT